MNILSTLCHPSKPVYHNDIFYHIVLCSFCNMDSIARYDNWDSWLLITNKDLLKILVLPSKVKKSNCHAF